MALSSLFPRARLSRARAVPPTHVAAIPAGQRVYAIGDIHGRSDCLDRLIAAIDADHESRGPAERRLILLGDLVDRGPDSRGVVERAMALATQPDCTVIMGNHEEILIGAWEGDLSLVRMLHRIGGRETLLSYGVAAQDYDRAEIAALAAMIATHVPPDHIAFMRRMIDHVVIGDYAFVHAGVRPGLALCEQKPSDMRWIRREFLDDRRDHGHIIVHGHSVVTDVEERPNRIGIDTGAFASGRLTAVGLEGADRWFLTG